MNILHLSTHDVGGAGKAAYRLHRNLLATGVDSKMIVLTRNGKDADVIPFGGNMSFSKFRSNLTKFFLKMRTDPKYYFQDHSQSAIKRVNDIYSKVSFKPDIIVAHWISNFVYAGVPIVWYLMNRLFLRQW